MFSGPVRGGTRGGQGDFKWTDVADDKDRENYLGHSILAPVGRWQKNRDITWYNKDGRAIDEDERARAKREEIQRIKAAEEDALSVALGFQPAPRDPMGGVSGTGTSSNAAPLGPRAGPEPGGSGAAEAEAQAEQRKAEKAARKAARALKRERKEAKAAKERPHGRDKTRRHASGSRDGRSARGQSRERHRRPSDRSLGYDDRSDGHPDYRPRPHQSRCRRSVSSEADRDPHRRRHGRPPSSSSDSDPHLERHSHRRRSPSSDPHAPRPRSRSPHHARHVRARDHNRPCDRPRSPPPPRSTRLDSPIGRVDELDRRERRQRSRSPARRAYRDH